ncbi:MAG: hypothetical protein LBQ49_01470 [Rickettsiales bacterium]|jgi:hypothetical protein|nr:hypothetical protein [Rickettsiales bacterium]
MKNEERFLFCFFCGESSPLCRGGPKGRGGPFFILHSSFFILVSFFILHYSFFIAPAAHAAERVRVQNTSTSSRGSGIRQAVASVAAPVVEEEIMEETFVGEPEDLPPDEYAGIDDRSFDFAERFGGQPGKPGSKEDETPLQKILREQREKMGLQAKEGETAATLQAARAKAGVDSALECDKALRGCMAKQCGGEQFQKCFGDGDTDWGMKMDSCRRETKCTGEEFAALSGEIKADRDQNGITSGFDEIIGCGRTYNNCIRRYCGGGEYTDCLYKSGRTLAQCEQYSNGYGRCASKSFGDKAVASCEGEYKKCQMADSGLQSRSMEFFAGLRVAMEKNVSNWEKELYALRDQMSGMCKINLGMFDERSLQCVYTVELFADNEGKSTQFASKKIHGGEQYVCTPDNFGIDITAFKENAYRLTRSQTAATSAAFGAGVGTAAGMLTSGAIGRAIESQKTAKAAADAQENMADTGKSASGGDNSAPSTPAAPAARAETPVAETPAPTTPVQEQPAPEPEDEDRPADESDDESGEEEDNKKQTG